ncbi:MAG: hypothetical protein IJ045_07085 [Ruminiclostridium sp.]|nr:hypothetical protein [Ruminiclostridium sp.]
MINYKDLEYVHKPDCNSKDSTNVEHCNEVYDKHANSVVEYDCYCKECGTYLYHLLIHYAEEAMNEKFGKESEVKKDG